MYMTAINKEIWWRWWWWWWRIQFHH